MTDHEQVPLRRASVDVDKGMVAILQWMNAIWAVHTLFSCEGTYDEEGQEVREDSGAYVLFYCHCNDLGRFLKHFARTGVTLGAHEGRDAGSYLRIGFQDGSYTWKLYLSTREQYEKVHRHAKAEVRKYRLYK